MKLKLRAPNRDRAAPGWRIPFRGDRIMRRRKLSSRLRFATPYEGAGTRAKGEEGPERVPAMPPGQAAALTSIFLACALAGFGILIFKTPFAIVAWTVEGSMPGGSCRTR
jgi:hypothetical protein